MDVGQMVEEGQMISLVEAECFANDLRFDAQQVTEALEKRIEELHWIWKE